MMKREHRQAMLRGFGAMGTGFFHDAILSSQLAAQRPRSLEAVA